MSVTEYLNKVRMFDELIDAKIAERDRLMDLATNVVPNMDGMPHATGTSDKVGNVAVKLATVTEDIDKLVDDYIDFKMEVCNALKKLPPMEYAVLHKHYVEGKSWNTVSRELGYSRMQIYRIKVKGLRNFQNVTQCYM